MRGLWASPDYCPGSEESLECSKVASLKSPRHSIGIECLLCGRHDARCQGYNNEITRGPSLKECSPIRVSDSPYAVRTAYREGCSGYLGSIQKGHLNQKGSLTFSTQKCLENKVT